MRRLEAEEQRLWVLLEEGLLASRTTQHTGRPTSIPPPPMLLLLLSLPWLGRGRPVATACLNRVATPVVVRDWMVQATLQAGAAGPCRAMQLGLALERVLLRIEQSRCLPESK
jgi:hypothetical protein